MSATRKVEVFSAGCPICEDTVALVDRIACDSCEVTVLEMNDPNVANRAKSLGIVYVPAVVIDGKLSECCNGRGADSTALQTAGLGQPLAG